MAGKRGDKQNGKGPTIVIRREEVVEGGHHGGAWKVAYADFVTAMMAFFLLMWLLNATTEEQRKGLADYFSPNNILSRSSSGTGQPFGGNSAMVKGALVSDRGAVQVTHGKAPVTESDDEDVPQAAQPAPSRAPSNDPDADAVPPASSPPASSQPSSTQPASTQPASTQPAMAPRTPEQAPAAAPGAGTAGAGAGTAAPGAIRAELTPMPDGQVTGVLSGGRQTETRARPPAPSGTNVTELARPPTPAELRAERVRTEKIQFEAAAEQIREAVRADPALADLGRQLAIDQTPEGLRIQIIDEEHNPMFATGSSVPNDRARALLAKVAPVIAGLPEAISLSGHTDAAPYRGGERTNWELSTERANATRRVLLEAGLPEGRIRNVIGNADRDPLVPGDPMAAANRRIAIVVLRGTVAPDK